MSPQYYLAKKNAPPYKQIHLFSKIDENIDHDGTSVLGVASPCRNHRGHPSWHGFVKRIEVFWYNGPPDFAGNFHVSLLQCGSLFSLQMLYLTQ